MKRIISILVGVVAASLCSCGYHLGGIKPDNMQNMNTFCVDVFENNTVQPAAGMLMTSAMTNALQSDGTYKLASRSEADFIVSGAVTQIERDSIMTSSEDSYVSKQLQIEVHVKYNVTDRRTGKKLSASEIEERADFFNSIGSTQNSMEVALSYALRRAADSITLLLTNQ